MGSHLDAVACRCEVVTLSATTTYGVDAGQQGLGDA